MPPISEATNLRVSRSPGSSVAHLYWDDHPAEDHHNVYRGEHAWLDDLACYDTFVIGTSLDDDGTVPPGGVYFHLVSAEDQCGESSLGKDSAGFIRPNPTPCP